ncbi:hypothetical protein [Acidipila sp. EB88]|uniref:hypothetical protein n=1 Tax=Acidipila sp. EB88 TaxID=2305226 RepID=UPI000F5E2CE8|nr:hypothetical protein [Acidipila sp. EB88]RRA48779.1 hypothetical protein D1Y84_11265 [Acidipila sp. EB88]
MHLSSNLSHWICLLAGLYLILTGVMLRDLVGERAALTSPPAHQSTVRVARTSRITGIGRRAGLIVVGIAAAAYGLLRILP